MDKTEEVLKEIEKLERLKIRTEEPAEYEMHYQHQKVILQQYAQQVSRDEKKHDSFWFDQFNERYPDEVTEILDNRQKQK